ncbi:MAG: DUF3592 domain-containing protein [Caldimonas sp.]
MTRWIVAVCSITAIAPMLAYVLWVVIRASKSKSWPTVEATVVDSRVKGGGNTHAPLIEYSYVIDGQRYTSRRRSIGPAISVSGGWAAKIVAAAPKGSTIVASVDPRDPACAVLVPGIAGAHLLMLAVFAGIVLACIATLSSGAWFAG